MSTTTLAVILIGCVMLFLGRSLVGIFWPQSEANTWLDNTLCQDPNAIGGEGDGGGDGGGGD